MKKTKTLDVFWLDLSLASSTRFERAAYCLGGNCSIHLSYEDIKVRWYAFGKSHILRRIKTIVKQVLSYRTAFQPLFEVQSLLSLLHSVLFLLPQMKKHKKE